MLTYRQKTGELLRDGKLLARGYAGYDDGDGVPEPGEGKNDPAAQERRGIGPLPVGRYRIGVPHTHATAGGYVMRLTPLYGTQTFGRAGFLIHGDFVDPKKRGSASHGCIILSRANRELVWASGERTLEVVADAPAAALSGGIA
jgi:lipoprotein-anchoring transpeptidase ErfK/SrfK